LYEYDENDVGRGAGEQWSGQDRGSLLGSALDESGSSALESGSFELAVACEQSYVSCVGDGIQAGIAVFAWVGSKIAAKDALVYGASRAGKVALIGAVMLSGFAAGYSIGTWANCLSQQ
jgi:hypothetical protein